MKPIKVSAGSLGLHDLARYVMEKKYDGHRAILMIEKGRKKLFTRQRTPISVSRELQGRISAIRMKEGTVLDGEIWNPLKRGGWASKGEKDSVLTFWDCIRLGTEDLSARSLEERRAALLGIIKGGDGIDVVEQEPASDQRVREIFEESGRARRESGSRSGHVHGVVLKLIGSPRRDHTTRSREHSDWLKIVFDEMGGWR